MAYELSELIRDWDWLIDSSDYTLLAISPFGDLLLQDKSGSLSLLDINLGALEPATESGTDPVKLFPIAFDDSIAAGSRGWSFPNCRNLLRVQAAMCGGRVVGE